MGKSDKQVVSGFHRPVCVKCNCELRPETNGVGVWDRNKNGTSKLWDADKWKCPKCGVEIVVGFGYNPVACNCDEDFQKHIKFYDDKGLLINNYE
jgi:hypothetical protein